MRRLFFPILSKFILGATQAAPKIPALPLPRQTVPAGSGPIACCPLASMFPAIPHKPIDPRGHHH